ncbi:40S ribosomal protein S10-like [Anopheles funestus]|uniref:40S ribosomal protein S10-like n=1 Tax=Anopheles funestus TaxID=62324 RepID=UPI0020C67F51|nr:40S ribosomal protein S10-like [Anopheles funestus]
MHITKQERIAIYKMLFNDGVMVAVKSRKPEMHCELKTIPNIHVILTMKSLVSKQYVKENYCWNHFYWTLNNEGIIYLRGYLHLPSQLVPSTLINHRREVPKVVGNAGTDRCFPSNPRTEDDRRVYRRLEGQVGSAKKLDDTGAGTNDLVFRGGFGRGSQTNEN